MTENGTVVNFSNCKSYLRTSSWNLGTGQFK